jgi:Family of unknown function (DUF6118)
MEPLTMNDTLAPTPDEVGSGDAAQAFEALRAEWAVHRAANTAGFQAVAEQMKVVADRQAEMAKSPALRQTPMQIADDQVRQRAEMLERVQNEWREPIRHANAEWNGLVKLTSGMRARSHQNWWLAGAGVAGLLLWPVLIMSLNTSASTRLVTWTLGYTDQWKAGNHLMHKANLTRMQNWTAAGALWDANLDAINACTAVPLAPGKKRVCALVLPDNHDVQN